MPVFRIHSIYSTHDAFLIYVSLVSLFLTYFMISFEIHFMPSENQIVTVLTVVHIRTINRFTYKVADAPVEHESCECISFLHYCFVQQDASNEHDAFALFLLSVSGQNFTTSLPPHSQLNTTAPCLSYSVTSFELSAFLQFGHFMIYCRMFNYIYLCIVSVIIIYHSVKLNLERSVTDMTMLATITMKNALVKVIMLMVFYLNFFFIQCMVCDCKLIWIKNIPAYNAACILLGWRNLNCTIVDVGVRNTPYLYEIKRHLLNKHDIWCHTIGIDENESDSEIDVFIKKEIQNIKTMVGIADVVTCINIFTTMHFDHIFRKDKPLFSDETVFRDAITSCANMLKRDTGVMIVSLANRIKPDMCIKIMNKTDALKHAEECCNKYFEECKHGLNVTGDVTSDEIRKYLTWLPTWTGINFKKSEFGWF